MGTGWELTKALREQIYKYASYPQTSVSLRQMVQFGVNPSPGSIFLASQFIVEELPIRLALKVKDLDNAPLGLSKMPSTIKVKNWYAQSFEELTSLPKPIISEYLEDLLNSNGGLDQRFKLLRDSPSTSSFIQEDNTIVEETLNPANLELANPAINNVFSDDGIVVRPSSSHHQFYQASSTVGVRILVHHRVD